MAQKNSAATLFVVVGVLVLIAAGLIYYVSLPATVTVGSGVTVVKNSTPADSAVPVATPVASGAAAPAPVAVVPKPAARALPRPATPASASPPTLTAAEVQAITDDLQNSDAATQKKALDELTQMATTDPRNLAVAMPKWVDALLATKKYDQIEELGLPAILGRAFDPTPVQECQRLRVTAMLNQGKYADALPLAKSYYNVATLAAAPDAVNMLATVLLHTADAATAAAFVKQQNVTGPAVASSLQPTGPLATIKVDTAAYDEILATMQSQVGSKGPSYGSFMGQGDLLLLMDHPAEARKCFEGAVQGAGTKTKSVREAIEGVARCVRAETGSIAAANDFISNVSENPTMVASLVGNPSPSADDIATAARNTKQADMTELLPAPTK